jgi:Lrp/AsnC family transcriptional regulator, leucine-responsive regulatory protein
MTKLAGSAKFMTEFSRADRQILEIVQRDGRISNVDLASRIGMSPSPCLRRVKELEQSGVIDRYVALLDRSKVGIGILAYVEIKVPQVPNVAINDRFEEAIQKEPAVIGCFKTTGNFAYLLKVVARDLEEFAEFTLTRLLKLPGVQDVNSSFVLGIVKDSTALPISRAKSG